MIALPDVIIPIDERESLSPSHALVWKKLFFFRQRAQHFPLLAVSFVTHRFLIIPFIVDCLLFYILSSLWHIRNSLPWRENFLLLLPLFLFFFFSLEKKILFTTAGHLLLLLLLLSLSLSLSLSLYLSLPPLSSHFSLSSSLSLVCEVVFMHVKNLSSAASPSCRHFIFHLATSPSLSLSLSHKRARNSLAWEKNLFCCAPLSLLSLLSLYAFSSLYFTFSLSLSHVAHHFLSHKALFCWSLPSCACISLSLSLSHAHEKILFIISFFALSPLSIACFSAIPSLSCAPSPSLSS